MLNLARAAILAGVTLATPALSETITLENAIALALNQAPEADANAARLEALRAARAQAGVSPNPTVELYGENLLGTGQNRFVDGAEITASYAQTIERGGKREARVTLASREIDVAEAEALVQRLDIAQRVQTAYVEAMTAQAMVEVTSEQLRLARALEVEVNRRVQEARDPLFAGTRAATRVAEAQVDFDLAEHARSAALTRLAALWDSSSEDLTVDNDAFFELGTSGDLQSRPSVADLRVYEARVRRAEAAIELERARRVQDPTVRGGVRYLNQSREFALVVGASIPLGRNDTNRANIARAIAERRQAEANIEVARVARLRAVRLAHERVEETRLEATAILQRVYPGAQRTLEQVREGFARGGFRHVDIDEAQTRLGVVRERIVDAAAEYHRARVELDRLTGRFAAPLPLEENR
ncbi:cobalt-zinc-cadmium efflux system outer membrane protein [Parasphingopyxis lamellibrachiae]|uniref:Cobalt-zinc-cadmium efflux system outer membrane protein n=1 Tax=Parasphingopyxis lamellibrachiae TaxID=680125 RepID=A0A3D9FFU7_9SPHN|nr:cobalt-zinc-cadmium efflux system outer membrane protein [Parasphingopyxis lamellibrachiae]